VQIIHDLDLEETTVSEMRIVQLKFANAADTVKLIDAIFKPDETGAAGGGRNGGMDPRMMMQQQGAPGQPGAVAPGGSSHRVRGHVIAAADDRTNTLIVNGPADALKIIDGLLLKLDSNPVPASIIRSFPLKYADAETTSKLVETIFTPPQQNGGGFPFFFGRRGGGQQQTENKQPVTASFDDRTNTVIVTAPAEAMKEIEGLIHSLDANPVSASDIKVFTLKYADSDAVAKLINAIFNPTNNGNSREVVPFFIFGGGPAQNSKGAKVNASSDYRTNTLIATAPSETMKVIEGIIKQLDSNPAAEDTLFIYHLRNATSANLEVVLNTLFGNVQNGQGNNQQQQNQNQGNRSTNSAFGNGSGGSSGRGLGQNSNSSNSNNSRNQSSNRPGNNRPGLSPGMAQAVNELSGQVFVVADQDTNSLIVTTATKYEKQVRDIIHELDRPVPQVLIKVLVAEVTHDNSADWGADYSILNQRANKLGQTFGQTFGAPANGLLVSVVENQLNVTLHALAVEGKLDVLSRPYILASDNQLAEILVGSEVPLINNSYVTELGQTINSFQYQKVGIILDVTPHINPEGLVIMDVAPEISQLTDQSVPVGPGVSAPVIADRSAQTRVGIRDGQTIVIGGLMADSKTTTINKIPILGDIPVLKYLFSRTQVDKTKTELLIFITPHVAQQADVLQPMTDSEIKGTKLTPRAVEPGVFDEHMRGMQRGEAPATKPADAVSPIFEPGGSRPPAQTTGTWSPGMKSDPSTRPASSQPAASGGASDAPAH
jgi:type II secretory pathway component GspD/PulD (secretin)